MIKSDEQVAIEKLAKKLQKLDKRLSWSTCLKRAKREQRLFNH